MTELHLVPARYSHLPRSLAIVSRLEPGAAPVISVSDEGEVTECRLDQGDSLLRLRRELRRPAGLVDLIGNECPDAQWRAAGLLLAAWEEMNRRGELGRTTDRWTRTLLLTLKARASLRAFAAAKAVDPGSWSDRATRDLLDAAAALEFFDPRLLAPFLQWLVAVLRHERARGLIAELLPVDGDFVSRVTEQGHRELGRVVQSVARALRRQYFFGRYDLRRAGRLRRLLGRLQYPRSGVRALAWTGWLFVVDRFVPRLLAGCVVGILPFLITDEAWRLATEVSILRISSLSLVAAVLVLVYLFYDRHQADPAGLSPWSGVVTVWLTGCFESLALAAGVQWLAAPSFHEALGYCGRFNGGVFLASAAFALGVGVFTQLIWQEKAVTAPP